ncbi:MAG: hypothetical protein IMF12_06870, partial [Proteobacteria bacterium]|nr:hypothetical protein [Pseudomonadota bacterium]
DILYSEPAYDNLTITAPILPSWLTLTDNGNGTATLMGTPTNNDTGINSIKLRVNDGTVNVEQNFTINVAMLYQLTVNKIGNGNIISTDGINCGNDCEQDFVADRITEVTFTATPDTGWVLDNWSGDCNLNGTVTMDNSKTCTATFLQQHFLTINITGQGNVNGCDTNCTQTYINGETVSLTTTSTADWKLANWSGDCNINAVIIIDSDKTCTAIFEQIILPVVLPDIPVVEPDVPVIEPDDTDIIKAENIAGEIINEGTLEDITIEPGAVVEGGIIAGDIINEGTLESVTIDRRALVEGGIIAGDVVNEGILANTTIEEGAIINGGYITGISNNEGTLQDTTIEGSISGGNYSGDTINEGLISNATVDEGATLTGGTITGSSTNNGTMTDITISPYAEVEGGDFSGDIVNSGTMTDISLLPETTITGGVLSGDIESEGTIQDVELAEGVQILGGTLAGNITGDPDAPALIGDVTIAPGTTLSYVILSPTTILPDDVKLGPGVILPDYDNPTPEDFGLASDDIKELQADDIANLEPEVFATLDETQIEEIPVEAFVAIGAEQLGQFSEEALAAISPEQFEQMPVEALAGLDAKTMDGLPIVLLEQFTPEHINNLNVEEFQKMPTEDISKLLVNLNLDNIEPKDIVNLIPEGWDFNVETGKLTAPFGAKITPKLFSTPDNMPTIPDMNIGMGLGGSGTPLMESTTESLAKEDLTNFVLSQAESGILNVEGIGAEDGKKYTFIPDAENVIQVDTDKIPIGLSIGAGGFYTITTPEGQQYKVIPAPQDPVALSEAIGGEVEVGKSGDVMVQLSDKVRSARNFQVIMFNPFVEPAPDSWCVFDDVGKSICDFDKAPADMQPGIHYSRERAKFTLPQAKVVYPDGSSQKITPAVYSPETFLAEGLMFPGVEKLSLNMNGTFYVLHEGREYIVAPNFTVQTEAEISPPKIELNEQGGVNYSVPIESPNQTRRQRESNMMLMFDLFVEPAPNGWCVDNDGAIFCDFDNMPD